jgi:hypothetical protein
MKDSTVERAAERLAHQATTDQLDRFAVRLFLENRRGSILVAVKILDLLNAAVKRETGEGL